MNFAEKMQYKQKEFSKITSDLSDELAEIKVQLAEEGLMFQARSTLDIEKFREKQLVYNLV
jgi:hypothetical protein